MNENNVIHIDPATFYCMRQCRESINNLTRLRNPVYDLEIKGEQELYRHFMKQTLRIAA
jgi:hypothetical protein